MEDYSCSQPEAPVPLGLSHVVPTRESRETGRSLGKRSSGPVLDNSIASKAHQSTLGGTIRVPVVISAKEWMVSDPDEGAPEGRSVLGVIFCFHAKRA